MDNCSIAALHRAFCALAENPEQGNYTRFLEMFFMCAKEKVAVHVPVVISGGGNMSYGLVNSTDGYYYVVCTSPEELVACPEKSSIVTSLDNIVVKAMYDNELGGICVNPYNDRPCFIPKQYILKVLNLTGVYNH